MLINLIRATYLLKFVHIIFEQTTIIIYYLHRFSHQEKITGVIYVKYIIHNKIFTPRKNSHKTKLYADSVTK